MTISTTTRKAGPYAGNGVATSFAFGFKVFQKSDLRVVLTSSDDIESTLVLDSEYSVTLNANQDVSPGGSVTYPISGDPLEFGDRLTLVSNVPDLQQTDITNGSGFYPSVIEDALDNSVILIQQNTELLGRALTVPVSTPNNVSTALPFPAANNVIGWNEDADALQNFDPNLFASVVSYGTAVRDLFTGDGATTVFNLSSNPGAAANLDVDVDGVTQAGSIDFLWTAGTALTFTTAPLNGVRIQARYMQGLPQGTLDAASVNFAAEGSVETIGSRSTPTIATLRALPKPTLSSLQALTISVAEHTAGSGKGGGAFRWDASSTAPDDNGRVINPTGNAGAGRWVRRDPRITVEQYGAFGNGIDDDQPAWAAVLAIANAGPDTLTVYGDSQRYKMGAGITINSTFASVECDSLFDFSSVTGTHSVLLTASVVPVVGNHFSRKGAFVGARLQGPAARDTSGSIGVRFDGGAANTTPGTLLSRVMVFNYDIGHQHQDYTYITAGYHCEIFRCRVAIDKIVGSDAGERITYIDSTFYNNALALRSNTALFFLHLVTCSLDYNDQLCSFVGGEAMLVSCHVEARADTYGTTIPIQLSGDGATFIMEGGKLLMTSLPLFTAWADVGAGAYCKLAPNTAFNCVTVASGAADTSYWFTGAGRYEAKYDWSYATSNNPRALSSTRGYLNDPGLEANSVSADLRFIAADTAAITDPFTGTNVSMATSATTARTGTYSLRVTKVGAAATAASVVLAAIPITPNRKVGGKVWMRKPGASTGTLFFDYRFVRIEYPGGIPTIRRAIAPGSASYVLPAGDTGWVAPFTIIPNVSVAMAPEWATHVVLFVSLVSWTGGGDFLYFDDFALDVVG